MKHVKFNFWPYSCTLKEKWLVGWLVVDEDLHMYMYDHVYKTIGDDEGRDIGRQQYWTSGVYLLG